MAEINNKYLELYEWWFNPSNQHCWFDATEFADENRVKLFGELIQIDMISQINLESLDFKQSIGFILANDQIIRHWVRVQTKLNNINGDSSWNEIQDNATSKELLIEDNDGITIKLSNKLLSIIYNIFNSMGIYIYYFNNYLI